jgi:hypothetical protein
MSDDIKMIELENLVLDNQNPRLPEFLPRDSGSMIDYIAETTSIEELMEVIAQNGYFPGEPLVAVPERDNSGKDTGKFIVVEGNRRLTALKLIQNPAIANTAGTKIHQIALHAKVKPTSIPVVVRQTREEVLPYLGFRHITGIKQWEPLAKARYIEQIFHTTDNTLQLHERYSEVARIIGSRTNYIKRSLESLEIYKVIRDMDFFEIESLDEDSIKFAVLSTALADDKISKFIGLRNDPASKAQSAATVSSTATFDIDAIRDLTKWLYEKDKKNGRTRVGESRNLRELAAVVDSPKALSAFRNGALLKVAYLQTADITQDFIQFLYEADSALVEAASMVATLDYDEEALQVIERLKDNIRLISRELQDKKRSNDDEF